METVKNDVIVRLNEFVNVKLAKISKSRRAQAKTDRTAAKYILDNMDDRDALAQIIDNESKEKTLSQELMVVLFDRIKQLDAASAKAINDRLNRKAEDLRKVGIVPARVGETFAVSYKDGSIEFYQYQKDATPTNPILFRQYSTESGKWGTEGMPIPVGQVTGVAYGVKAIRSLCRGKVTDKQMPKLTKEEPKKVQPKTTKVQQPKTDSKAATQPHQHATSGGHKVGDLHKNGLWVWTEYKPGKFDWRIRPELKKAPGAKKADGSTKVAAKKAEPKKSAKPQESIIKADINPDLKDAKGNTVRHGMYLKIGDALYIAQLDPDDDLLKVVLRSVGATAVKDIKAKAIDASINYSVEDGLKTVKGKLSLAQDKAVGLLKKGYRLAVIDGASFLRKGSKNVKVDMPTLTAIFFNRSGRKLLPYDLGYIGKING